MASIIQVLKVNDVVNGTSKAGKPYKRQSAECIVLNDDGTVHKVGRFDVPRAQIELLEVGTYRCAFSIDVPSYGDEAGSVGPVVDSLILMPVKGQSAPAPAAAPKA